MSVSVFGARILNLFGNLRNGVVGKIDLFLAKGEVRLFLKNRRGEISLFFFFFYFFSVSRSGGSFWGLMG